MSAARPAKEWPSWIDDVLAYAPIAELEDEWRAAIGHAITRMLDLRAGSRQITCACCGASKTVPAPSAPQQGDPYKLDVIRENASDPNTPMFPAEVVALVDAVEAAHRAVILEHDPQRTDSENRLIKERADVLQAALARFSFNEDSP